MGDGDTTQCRLGNLHRKGAGVPVDPIFLIAGPVWLRSKGLRIPGICKMICNNPKAQLAEARAMLGERVLGQEHPIVNRRFLFQDMDPPDRHIRNE